MILSETSVKEKDTSVKEKDTSADEKKPLAKSSESSPKEKKTPAPAKPTPSKEKQKTAPAPPLEQKTPEKKSVRTVEDKNLIESLLLKQKGIIKKDNPNIKFETVKEAEDSATEDVVSAIKDSLSTKRQDISELQKAGYKLHLQSISLLQVPLKTTVWKATHLKKDLEAIFQLINEPAPLIEKLKAEAEEKEKAKEERIAKREAEEKLKEQEREKRKEAPAPKEIKKLKEARPAPKPIQKTSIPQKPAVPQKPTNPHPSPSVVEERKTTKGSEGLSK